MKVPDKTNYLQRINTFFDSKNKSIYVVSLIFCFILSCLLFELKISTGADDSEYIASGVKFIKGEAFPGWHGSFYQIILGLFISIFGVKLVILKLFSFLFIILHLVLFRKTFLTLVPNHLLSLTLLFIAINPYILQFASLTYSEALYFFIQIACIYYCFKIIDKLEIEKNLFNLWREWLVVGLLLFLLSITRNIGISLLISLVLFFAINRKWKAALFSFSSFMIFQLTYSLYKFVWWGSSKVGMEDQFGLLFLKDPYKPALGNINFQDLLVRFFENLSQYTTQHILPYLGITDGSGQPNLTISIFCVLIFIS